MSCEISECLSIHYRILVKFFPAVSSTRICDEDQYPLEVHAGVARSASSCNGCKLDKEAIVITGKDWQLDNALVPLLLISHCPSNTLHAHHLYALQPQARQLAEDPVNPLAPLHHANPQHWIGCLVVGQPRFTRAQPAPSIMPAHVRTSAMSRKQACKAGLVLSKSCRCHLNKQVS